MHWPSSALFHNLPPANSPGAVVLSGFCTTFNLDSAQALELYFFNPGYSGRTHLHIEKEILDGSSPDKKCCLKTTLKFLFISINIWIITKLEERHT